MGVAGRQEIAVSQSYFEKTDPTWGTPDMFGIGGLNVKLFLISKTLYQKFSKIS